MLYLKIIFKNCNWITFKHRIQKKNTQIAYTNYINIKHSCTSNKVFCFWTFPSSIFHHCNSDEKDGSIQMGITSLKSFTISMHILSILKILNKKNICVYKVFELTCLVHSFSVDNSYCMQFLESPLKQHLTLSSAQVLSCLFSWQNNIKCAFKIIQNILYVNW